MRASFEDHRHSEADPAQGHHPRKIDALRAIGATLSLGLLETALTLFPEGKAPVARSERCAIVFAFKEGNLTFLENLDAIFYTKVALRKSPPEEDPRALELAFMKIHRDGTVGASG